jgi:hypothetical protein
MPDDACKWLAAWFAAQPCKLNQTKPNPNTRALPTLGGVQEEGGEGVEGAAKGGGEGGGKEGGQGGGKGGEEGAKGGGEGRGHGEDGGTWVGGVRIESEAAWLLRHAADTAGKPWTKP